MIEYYENLSEEEQLRVSASIATLLKQTFLLEYQYDRRTKRFMVNKDFYQCDKHLEFIQNYFRIMGMEVCEQTQLGIIYLCNGQVLGEKLSKLSTLYLLILKLIYDEQMAAVSSSVHVYTTIGEIHDKMNLYRLFKKEPSQTEIKKTISLLKRYQIIDLEDTMEELDGYSKIVIYPTINVLLMGDDVRALLQEFDEEGEASDGDEP